MMFGTEETHPPRGNPSFVLATAIAFVIGGAAGAAGFAMAPRTAPQPRELTPDELSTACAPAVEPVQSDLAAVQEDLDQATGTISTLEAQVEAKKTEIAELQATMAERAERGAALAGKLERAKTELASLEAELAAARETQQTLEASLADTTTRLEAQVGATATAKEEALDHQWHRFVEGAQLAICDAGGRKRLGRCRDTVAGHLDLRVQRSYEHCVRAGQEAPYVALAGTDAVVPKYAHWLGQESKVTKDWYVLLCDPSLPEADYWEEVPPLIPVDDGVDDDQVGATAPVDVPGDATTADAGSGS